MNFRESYSNCCSLVGLAARNGDLESLRKLLRDKKDYCIKDNRGWFPIHEAAYHGHTSCVKELIETAYKNGDDPIDIWQSPYDRENYNALVLAARQGHFETVKALSNLYRTDSIDFQTGIEASLQHPKILQYLLARYTDNINIKNYLSCTFLHSAVSDSPIESFELLFEYGINVHSEDNQGRTALHYACKATRHDRVDLIKYLVSKGGDVNTSDYVKCSAMFVAAQHGLLDVVQYLLVVHADPFLCFDPLISGLNGFVAPINIAAEKGYVEILEEFFKCMNLKQILQKGIMCPLVSAVIGSNIFSLNALLNRQEYQEWLLNNYKADERLILDYFDWISLSKTKKESLTYYSLKLLLERGACIKPVCKVQKFYSFFCDCSSVEVMKLLLKHGCLEFCFFNKNFIPRLQKVVLNRLQWYNYHNCQTDAVRINVIAILEFLPVVKCDNIYIKMKKLTNIVPIVPLLRDQVRFFIQKILLQASGHLRNIAKLPLPKLLQQYLISCSLLNS